VAGISEESGAFKGDISYSCATSPGLSGGKIKQNQDTFFAITKVFGKSDWSAFGVLDGHGQHGKSCSLFAKGAFVRILSRESELDESVLDQHLAQAFQRVHNALCGDDTIDSSLSGTTASIVIVTSTKLYSANVGDSHCIITKKAKQRRTSAFQITEEHTANVEQEAIRVRKSGGRVHRLSIGFGEDIGPQRVWLANEDSPGLAISRSIGDEVAHSVGVTSIPSVAIWERSEQHNLVVLASDGVWDHFEAFEVAKVFERSNRKTDIAARRIVAESYKRWQISSPNVVDDITAVVVSLSKEE